MTTPELLPGQTVVPSTPDERFRIRGPYWVAGMSVLAEPWVALAEANTGHLVAPCGRSIEAAQRHVRRWEAMRAGGLLVDVARTVVGAAVVSPRGEVVEAWGSVPVPGGPPRWAELHRVVVALECGGCGEPRWPGCWMTADLAGCGVCLPEREAADPRPWPVEVAQPRVVHVVARAKTPRSRRAGTAAPVVIPDESRLF